MSGAPATRLRIDHGPAPLGVGSDRPRLSWWLPRGSTGQVAYQIAATVDGRALSSGVIDSAESVLRPWPFGPLGSRSQVDWRVLVRTEAGWGAWSEPDRFETGLLDVGDWSGRFVGAAVVEPLPPRGERGAIYFRRRVWVPDHPARARVYATAHGNYELHLDGVRLGDAELTPGATAYRTHLEVQTYDITDRLAPGQHELTATVTDGCWRGSNGTMHLDRCYGTELALLAQVEITDLTGARTVIATDASWEVTGDGPIRAADLMEGQRVDQRVPFPPTTGWHAAVVLGEPDGRLTVSPAPPTRRTQEYRPVSVTRLDAERQVVDLGANINGWVRLAGSALGPAGNRVRLRHGERLGEDGDVDARHLGFTHPLTGEPVPVGMVDEVISDGRGDIDFEPRHTTHGFQFVGIDGAPDLTPEDLTGIMVHTDLTRTGWFRCSDERINALHAAAVLSFRGNACEIPTDCPTRERAGWTGDWQLFAPTAAFLYDIAGFSARWLRDLAAEQFADGRVPNFVPYPLPRDSPRANEINGSAGWGDAAVYGPYQVWQSYGDVDILARQYDSMRSWVDYALRRAAEHRHPARVAARPEPAPHERYLWDIGFHWGEWLEPGTEPAPSVDADHADVATAYLYRSLATLADVAGLLGNTADADHYRELASQVRAAWRAEFLTDDGAVIPSTQANLTRALAFGLVDDPRVADDLVTLVRAAGTHLGTGFLATPFLLPVLADHGHLDLAYELLGQSSPPSWLYMIDAGATTIWENWEGLDARGRGSLNHYSKGAVISFLHEYVAGLRPIPDIPAYRRFEIRPRPGGGITSAHAHLDTPHGPISAAWRLEGDTFVLAAQVAPGTEARITLPDRTTHTRGPGDHQLTCPIADVPSSNQDQILFSTEKP